MKYTLITIVLLSFLCLTACGNKMDKKEDSIANEIEEEVVENTEDDDPILLGEISKAKLTKSPYKSWFTENYKALQLNDSVKTTIKSDINAFNIEVYMGTWCSDSQREVPQLYNLLEQVEFPMSQFSIIAIDEDKVQPEALLSNKDIDYVPTIIFKKDGKEINRFVESAQETLAQDIAKIVSGEEYKNIYAE